MVTHVPELEQIPRRRLRPAPAEKPLCARDRLLAALESSPRLKPPEADLINRVVQEAREASLADELSA